MSFKGYVDLEDTLYFLFTTRKFSTGAPFLLAGTPVLSAYEENNLTQITAGVSVSADYDSVTGLNQATVVATAANGYEAGKRYEIVITTGTVDSVSVVGEVVGSFTVGPQAVNVTQLLGTAWLPPAVAGTPDVNAIEISGDATAANNAEAFFDGTGYAGTNNVIPTVTTVTTATNVTNNVTAVLADDAGHGGASSAITLSDYSNFQGAASPHPEILQTTTITISTQTSFTLAAGSADDDAYNGCLAVIEDASTSTQKCVGVISDYVGSSKTVTLAADPGVFTMANGDNIDIIAQQAMRGTDSAATVGAEMGLADGAITAAKFGAGAIDATALGDASITAAKFGASAVDAAALATDAVTEIQSGLATPTNITAGTITTVSGNVDGSVGSVTGHTAQTGDSYALVNGATGVAAIHALAAAVDTLTKAAGNGDLAAILADTNELQTDWKNAGRLDAILDIIAADTTTDIPALIATESTKLDLLVAAVDTAQGEPGQGAPPVSASMDDKIAYLYKAWRNKVTQTATEYKLYADNGTTVDQKGTVSDDTTTFTKPEIISGA